MQFREQNISSYAAAILAMHDFAADLGFVVYKYEPIGNVVASFSGQPTTGVNSPRPGTPPLFMMHTNLAEDSFSLMLGEGWNNTDFQPTVMMGKQTIDHYRVRAQNGVDGLTPSKVSMFGYHPQGAWFEGQKAPWLAMVITYEFNYVRHVYLGYMERAGAYTGGEVMSIGNGPAYRFPVNNIMPKAFHHNDSQFAHHFGANNKRATTQNPVPTAGGVPVVRVVHPNNPYPIRPLTAWSFWTGEQAVISPVEALPPDSTVPAWPAFAFGGAGDGPNDPLMSMAHGEACNSQIMVPINLFMTDVANRFIPLGHPAGIRYVNMRDLAPEESFAIGSDMWRAFPEIHRSDDPVNRSAYDTSDGLGVKRRQSSGYIGYAYPENQT